MEDFVLNIQTSGAASSAATVPSVNQSQNEKTSGQCSLFEQSLPLVESSDILSETLSLVSKFHRLGLLLVPRSYC